MLSSQTQRRFVARRANLVVRCASDPDSAHQLGDRALREARTYAVVGSGALGGFYGARLQRSGRDVHFLMHSGVEHVLRNGFRVTSPDGDFDLPKVFAYSEVGAMPPCDVVILAMKTTANHLLPQLLPPVVRPGGVVLVLQNGLGIEAQVAAVVGDDRVMGGGCFLCSNKVSPGVIHHIDYGDVVLGEYCAQYAPYGVSTRMRQVAGDLNAAGITVKLEEDLFIARWKKLMWNIPYNGTSVLLSATTDQMMSSLPLRENLRNLMLETVAAAAATAQYLTPGLPSRSIPPAFSEYIMKFTAEMQPYRPSMLLDHSAGRPMEVEALYGTPVRMAQEAGCAVPRIEALYQQLLFLDGRRAAAAATPAAAAAASASAAATPAALAAAPAAAGAASTSTSSADTALRRR